MYILALKVQIALGHSHPKEEKTHTKFLIKFKSMGKKIKQKHLWRGPLYCLVVGKGQMAAKRGRYFT